MDKSSIILISSILGGLTLLIAIPSIFYARATPEGKTTMRNLASPGETGGMYRRELGRGMMGYKPPSDSPPSQQIPSETPRSSFNDINGNGRDSGDVFFGPLNEPPPNDQTSEYRNTFGGKLKNKSGKNKKTKRRKNKQTRKKK